MRKRFFLAVAAIAVLSLGALAVACGGDDDDDTPSTSNTGASTGAATGSTGSTGSNAGAGGGNGLPVAAIDLGYQPASIEGTAGEELTIAFENQGSLPHTFTIDGIVDSGNVAGGASTTVSFTPASAGELEFYCTIHGRAAMSGTLSVE